MDPTSMGWHATFYTDAASAWLQGGDPWITGPPGIIFGGPPTMLIAFAPWVWVIPPVTRAIWVVGSLVLAIDVLRRLHLPMYFLAFPPLFEAIAIGHPEVLVLWLLTASHPMSALAAVIKPYAVVSLIAERRVKAVLFAAAIVAITAPFLPWGRFVKEFPAILRTLSVQANGDSTFGTPWMLLAILCLAIFGWRRALWLATPVLWPNAQFNYRVGSIPMLSPIIALCWAVHIPGATLVGIASEAGLLVLRSRRALPPWLESAIMPISTHRVRTYPSPETT
jgi:hypothetical protein